MTIPIRLRTKSFKLGVSEADALSIVNPLVSVTAYLMSVHDTLAMPQVETFAATVRDAKTRLASLLSTAAKMKIDPNELGAINVTAYPYGGYFRIELLHETDRPGGHPTRQAFNISLRCITGLPLIMKLGQLERHNHPDDDIEETIRRAHVLFKKMGL